MDWGREALTTSRPSSKDKAQYGKAHGLQEPGIVGRLPFTDSTTIRVYTPT